MKFAFFLARRYLLKGRKSSFISVVSIVSVLGISIGVAALIIALALIDGFQKDVRDRILEASAHILVSAVKNEGIGDYEQLQRKIKALDKRIIRVQPVVYDTVLFQSEGGQTAGAVLRGINFKEDELEFFLKKVESGRLPQRENEVVLGKELAMKLGVFPGDTLRLLIARWNLSPAGLMPRIKKIQVSGIFSSGLYEFDNNASLARLDFVQSLLKLDKRVHYLQINLSDIFASDEISLRLMKILPAGFSVVSWKELNASLYTAFDIEKKVLFLALTLIIIVAALNIVSGLILMVFQKIRDIGILLSCGAEKKAISSVFFLQGAIIGFCGTLLGTIFGLLFCNFANRFQLIRLPADIYQLSYLTFRINTLDLLLVILTALSITFFATLIPVRRLAAIQAADAVKFE